MVALNMFGGVRRAVLGLGGTSGCRGDVSGALSVAGSQGNRQERILPLIVVLHLEFQGHWRGRGGRHLESLQHLVTEGCKERQELFDKSFLVAAGGEGDSYLPGVEDDLVLDGRDEAVRSILVKGLERGVKDPLDFGVVEGAVEEDDGVG